MSESFVTSDIKEITAKLQDFVSSLPADTKSVQFCVYAYADDYDNWKDTTKTLKEDDAWYVLPDEIRTGLLDKSVRNILKQLSAYVSSPEDTEEEIAEKETTFEKMREKLSALARSFVVYNESIDTAFIAQENLLKLFNGILALKDRKLFEAAFEIFRKKKNLEMDELRWNLLCGVKQITKPVQSVKIENPDIAMPAPKTDDDDEDDDDAEVEDDTEEGEEEMPKVGTPIK